MRTHWFRLCCAAVAMICGGVLWPLSSLAATLGWTPLMLAAGVAVASAGLMALVLIVVRQRDWERIEQQGSRFVASLRTASLTDNRRIGRWLMATGIAGYLLLSGWHLSRSTGVTDDDQSAFLQTATEVHADGGPLQLVRDLYAGRFTEANRHPLYIGLLSLHPTWSFGRGLSLLIGATTLLTLTWLVRRSQGELVAGLFCLLLGTNGAFCLFSTRIVCEVLLVLWTGLAYWLIAQTPLTLRSAALTGAVLGLAYLTKGTGLLLIAGYYLWWGMGALLRRRHRDFPPDGASGRRLLGSALPTIVVLTVTLCIVVSPMVTRNIRRFDAPFYNVNSQLLFVDEYQDPLALAEQRSTREAAREYLRSHTAGDILRREARGLVWESFILLRILGPAPLDDARILFGLPLLICALIAVVADPRPEQGLLGVWIIICVPLFAWYIDVAAGDRFPLLLLAPLLMLAAEGIARLTRVRSTARQTLSNSPSKL